MTSLPFIFTPAVSGRVFTAKATKGGGSTTQEKGFIDWLLGNLTKEDQFYETDPILQKVEGKSTTTSGTKSGTVSISSKKRTGGNGGGGEGNGGVFGGLFAKKQ